jgi:hypothetical protein
MGFGWHEDSLSTKSRAGGKKQSAAGGPAEMRLSWKLMTKILDVFENSRYAIRAIN